MAATTGPRLSRAARALKSWRRLRQAVQVLALLLFLYLLLGTRQGGETFLAHDLFFRLDPLAGIAAMLSGRGWIAGLALGGIVLLLTLAVGRVWCGWLCPLGTLLDWTPARRARRGKLDVRSRWRQAKYFLLLAVLCGAAFGTLTLLVLDPITLLFRALGSALLPALSALVTAVETWLYGFEPLQPAVEWLDGATRGWLVTGQPFLLANMATAALLAAVLLLNAIRRRWWCRYLCPLGGLLGLLSRFALLRRRVDGEACSVCHECAVACPAGAVRDEPGFSTEPGECLTCLRCVEECPRDAVSFAWETRPTVQHDWDPARRQFLASLGAAALVGIAPRLGRFAGQDGERPIRPPGASEEQLLGQCIRCGECAKVCPTGVIQPSLSLAGWEGLWTPGLETRLGYCDYSCNACGQACPTGAITDLSLGEKRLTRIGVAVIDRARCMPWAGVGACIVCEEMCPVPQKAIRLEERGMRSADGGTATVLAPRVVSDLCIGCGICEYQCPVEGEAAIRIGALPDAM